MEAGYPSEDSPVAIDTHAHVSMEDFDGDRDAVIMRARSLRVNSVEIGFDVESSRKSVSLARRVGGRCAVGIHPHNAGDSLAGVERAWDAIESLVSEGSPEIAAIGEIGLDYARDFSPRDVQAKCFEMGLRLAGRKRLPVVIHQRDAAEDVLAVVRVAKPAAPVVFHCFAGDADYAGRCLDLGGYLGLGGILTYPKNEYLRQAVRSVPLDRILLETDSPYLAPQRLRGKRNEPAFVLETARLLAGLLGLSPGEVVQATSANARAAFLGGVAWEPR